MQLAVTAAHLMTHAEHRRPTHVRHMCVNVAAEVLHEACDHTFRQRKIRERNVPARPQTYFCVDEKGAYLV